MSSPPPSSPSPPSSSSPSSPSPHSSTIHAFEDQSDLYWDRQTSSLLSVFSSFAKSEFSSKQYLKWINGTTKTLKVVSANLAVGGEFPTNFTEEKEGAAAAATSTSSSPSNAAPSILPPSSSSSPTSTTLSLSYDRLLSLRSSTVLLLDDWRNKYLPSTLSQHAALVSLQEKEKEGMKEKTMKFVKENKGMRDKLRGMWTNYENTKRQQGDTNSLLSPSAPSPPNSSSSSSSSSPPLPLLPSQDPFLLVRQYENDYRALRASDSSYKSAMYEIFQTYRTDEIKRVEMSKQMLLDFLLQQKNVMEKILLETNEAIGVVKNINPVEDYKTQIQSCGIMADANDIKQFLGSAPSASASSAPSPPVSIFDLLPPSFSPTISSTLFSLYSSELIYEGPLFRPGRIVKSNWKGIVGCLSAGGIFHYFDNKEAIAPIESIDVKGGGVTVRRVPSGTVPSASTAPPPPTSANPHSSSSSTTVTPPIYLLLSIQRPPSFFSSSISYTHYVFKCESEYDCQKWEEMIQKFTNTAGSNNDNKIQGQEEKKGLEEGKGEGGAAAAASSSASRPSSSSSSASPSSSSKGGNPSSSSSATSAAAASSSTVVSSSSSSPPTLSVSSPALSSRPSASPSISSSSPPTGPSSLTSPEFSFTSAGSTHFFSPSSPSKLVIEKEKVSGKDANDEKGNENAKEKENPKESFDPLGVAVSASSVDTIDPLNVTNRKNTNRGSIAGGSSPNKEKEKEKEGKTVVTM